VRNQWLARIATVVVLAFLLPAGARAQQEDTTPPVLQSFSLAPDTVDVTNGAQSVTFTARVTDDLAGVDYGLFYFVSPSRQQWRMGVANVYSRISGDEWDGVYRSGIDFPQYSEAGVYHLDRAYIYDRLGNGRAYSEQDFLALGFPTTIRVTYNEPPTAEAGANRAVLVGEAVSFDGSASSDPDGSVTGWQWDFGDNATATGMAVTHIYTAAGQFTLTLTVTDDAGATASDTASVTVQTVAQGIQSLMSAVQSLNLQVGIANSLDAKLENALEAYQAAKAGNRQDAANKLRAFINEVEAQRGKKLTSAQATQLIAVTNRILGVL